MKSRNSIEKLDQIDRFKEAARQLETDESEAAFDQKLKKILPVKGAHTEPEKPGE